MLLIFCEKQIPGKADFPTSMTYMTLVKQVSHLHQTLWDEDGPLQGM